MPVPNNIHLFWCGSFLRQEHQDRILLWGSLNPKHKIHLWIRRKSISDQIFQQFTDFYNQHDIVLLEIDALDLDKNTTTRQWLWKLWQQPVQNYGALSDLYRFFILAHTGGWYIDTDIIPRSLPINLSLKYGFAIYGSNNPMTKVLTGLTPSILVSTRHNGLTLLSRRLIHCLARDLPIPFITATLYSRDLLTRVLSTHYSTGSIFFYVITKMIINYDPVLFWQNTNPVLIDHRAFSFISLIQLGYEFQNKRESTWIYNENLRYMASQNFYDYYNGKHTPEPPLSLELTSKVLEAVAKLSNCRIRPLASPPSKLTFFTQQQASLTVKDSASAVRVKCPGI